MVSQLWWPALHCPCSASTVESQDMFRSLALHCHALCPLKCFSLIQLGCPPPCPPPPQAVFCLSSWWRFPGSSQLPCLLQTVLKGTKDCLDRSNSKSRSILQEYGWVASHPTWTSDVSVSFSSTPSPHHQTGKISLFWECGRLGCGQRSTHWSVL